jgi:hypothetical protein
MLQIHDRRAMNPRKNLGIQLSLEISHGVAEHMAIFAGADSYVILFRGDPTNIRNRQEEDSALGSKDQPVGMPGMRTSSSSTSGWVRRTRSMVFGRVRSFAHYFNVWFLSQQLQ